jgi:phospholipase/carboxylesterase
MGEQHMAGKDIDFTSTRLGPLNGGKPKQLVFLLHGVTKDSSEYAPHLAEFAKTLPDAEFIALNAPYVYEGGLDDKPVGVGRQWFSIKNRQNYLGMWFQTMKMSGEINRFIDKELARHGLDDNHLALFGFSQGAIMANYVAMRRDRPPAAVVSHSGDYIGWAPAKCAPDIMVIHGTEDKTVPFSVMESTVRLLRKAGAKVTPVVREGLAHDMVKENIEFCAKWMGERFAAAATRDLSKEKIQGTDIADVAVTVKDKLFPDTQKPADPPRLGRSGKGPARNRRTPRPD